MLAVVHPSPPVPEGPGEPTQVAAPFEHRDPGAAVGTVEGGGQPGEAAADHHNLPAPGQPTGRAHAVPPTRARRATAAFSGPDSDIRPRSTPAGSPWIRTSSRR